MFTGIIEDVGTVRALEIGPNGETLLDIESHVVTPDTREGDSIAVNGVCLTVVDMVGPRFRVGLAPETLRRSSLGVLDVGSRVNLERSLAANGRFGGHIVQGHVETTAIIRDRTVDGDSLRLTFAIHAEWSRYIVPKGYIAIDGISLTVIDAQKDWFSVMLIAYTQQHVTLARQAVGYAANIETDIMGRYLQHDHDT